MFIESSRKDRLFHAREFDDSNGNISFFLTLPKCIIFVGRGGKVNAVISKVFGVEDYKSQVRTSKLKMADSIWPSYTQNSINFEFSCYDWPENYYSRNFKIIEDGCKFRFGDHGSKIHSFERFLYESFLS